MFGTSSDYHELNAEAHRNSPKNLSAPALTCHLAFWIQNPGQINELRKKLDTFLLTLCRALKADNKTVKDVRLRPCVSSKVLLFSTIVHESLFEELKCELTCRESDVFKSSSRAVSAKFKWHNLDITMRCELHTEYFSLTTFAEINKNHRDRPLSDLHELTDLSDLKERIDDMLAYLNGKKPEIRAGLNEYFFRKFWDSFFTKIMSDREVSGILNEGIFQQVFVDIRGLILSELAVRFFDSEDFFAAGERPSWGKDAKKQFLPLLEAHNFARLGQYECAATYMLDGRAIHLSRLAPQLPETPDEERIPLEFVIYAHQRDPTGKTIVNERQLGRLINQVHLLDTLRVAALKNVKFLHDAGKLLSELAPIVQKARDSVAETERRTAMALIQNAHDSFNSISADFLSNAKSGLSYRIARSSYYVKRFRSNVQSLRIRRLEGDQPYDQFVERRLGAEFDFIDSLGKRYERAANDIWMLDQNYLSIETRLIDEDTKKIDDDIRIIQKGGEFALLAALVPYYVTQLLAHFVPETFLPILAIGMWTGFGSYACYRHFEKRRYWVIVLSVGLFFFTIREANWPKLSQLFSILEKPSEQLEAQRELLSVQKELREMQREQMNELNGMAGMEKEQLRVQKEVLDALNAEREKNKDAPPPRLSPKHQKRSAP